MTNNFTNGRKRPTNFTNSWSSESRLSLLGVCRVVTRMDEVNSWSSKESLAIPIREIRNK